MRAPHPGPESSGGLPTCNHSRIIVNKPQTRSLLALRGALAFLEKGRTPKDSELPHLRARLRDTVEKIGQTAADQTVRGGRLVGSARRQLDNVREKHMLTLADVTRPLFVGEASVLAALRVPHKRATADEILLASALMTKTLHPHRRFLTAAHVDTRRIQRLREETRQVKKLFDAASARTPTSTVATSRLRPLFVSARRDLKAIDTLMRASASPNDLAVWRSVTRVGKRIGRPRKPRRRPPPSE
jgi:hypothetical protein